jgi:hypothetical protein
MQYVSLRQGKAKVRAEYDRHIMGLFERAVWLRLLKDAGFEVEVVEDEYDRELFVGVKR